VRKNKKKVGDMDIEMWRDKRGEEGQEETDRGEKIKDEETTKNY
jgi:hypothetical protein